MIADIVVVAFVCISVYLGYKRGFVRTMSKLLCLVVSIVVASMLHPVVSEYLKTSVVGDYITNSFAEKTHTVTEGAPTFIQNVANSTAEGIANTAITVVTIVIIIIVTFVLTNLIVKSLNIVAKLPVVSFVNRLFGIVSGFFMGVLLIYVIMAVIAVSDIDLVWFEDSQIAIKLYSDNIIMNMIF